MILTTKQEAGLRIAVERFNHGERYTVISGFAGTGKSTLIKFIISALNLYPEDVCYVAYTGKAANVLKQKGCPNPITAHKLLYKAKPMPNGTYKFVEKPLLEEDYKLIVVDEVSMLPKPMWELLLKHRIHVIACGDPEQLPPIREDDNNHVLDKPHVFLDEIMRQAAESEIIRLSMHTREGKSLDTFQPSGQQVMFINKSDLVSGVYEWADQMICAKNDTRTLINQTLRKIRGYDDEPQIGDKIISLANQWEFLSSGNEPYPLTNGSIGTITHLQPSMIHVPHYIYPNQDIPILYTSMETEDNDVFDGIPIDYNTLRFGKKTLEGRQEYMMRKNTKYPDPPFEFAYAYAITCHKAQGSEWKKVLVFEENWPFKAEEKRRWLYTAETRASDKLVIVRNY